MASQVGYFGLRVESFSIIFISYILGLCTPCILVNFNPGKRWECPLIGKLGPFQMLLGTEAWSLAVRVERNLGDHFIYCLIFIKYRFRELR